MNAGTDFPTLLKQPSAWLPMLMSLAALSLIFVYAVLLQIEPEPGADEGFAAHLFQTLMLLQIPLVLYFVVRWLGRRPIATVMVVSMQTALWLSAFMTIYLLEN